MKRGDTWLKEKLDKIWELLFSEVPRENNFHVKFKGKSIRRFGCIKKKGKDSIIEINSLFKKIRHDLNYRGFRATITQAEEIIDFWRKCEEEILKILKKEIEKS